MKIKIAMLVTLFGVSALVAQAQKVEGPAQPHDNSMKALPDLVVKDVRRQKPGSSQIVITIANVGKGEAAASHWTYACTWHPQADGSMGAMFPSSPIQTGPMKTGEVRKFTNECESPAGKKIRFSITLDVNKEVKETNESNNKTDITDVP